MILSFLQKLFKQEKQQSIFFVPNDNHKTGLVRLLLNSPKLSKQLIVRTPISNSILPVFIHPFLLDPDCEVPFDETVIQHHRQGINVLLDFSTEALVFKPDNHLFSLRLKKLHEFLKEKDIDASKVILLNSNTADPNHYADWCRRNEVSQPMQVVGYDFYMLEYSHSVSKHYDKNKLFKEILRYSQMSTSHKYIATCLNLKPKPHRYCVASMLRHLLPSEDLLLSFTDKAEGKQKLECLDFANKLEKAPEVLPAITKLETAIPIKVDYFHAFEIQKNVYKMPGAEGYWDSILLFQNKSRPLLDSIIDIVNETWFTDDSCRFFSEKTLRPLVTLRPFIIVGSPFSLQRLKELGYKTFHPYINEEYDNISDPVMRMNAILTELDRLFNKSKSELESLYITLKDILTHNYFHALQDQKINQNLIDSLGLNVPL
ncbi:MAG: hypothetical protein K2W94_02690 [Alphaproteobacteria bacterium]|nr:hypothetical protein [Alphaproteobacteria bacterium]